MTQQVRLRINGELHELSVEPRWSLLYVIRDQLGLTGTKRGCEHGDCGSCTVLLDGVSVNSCLVLAVEANGREVTTIEGLAQNGKPHPLQKEFVELGAIGCGYCTPGMLMSAKVLLDEIPHPTEKQVREGISGNLCRCTGYAKIVKAVLAAAQNGG
ncbi:MAG: (2Fe-2S)-binding protein [Chloroflexi bacterium]|nr:(2Fe-2S)-binding protein [Chloroflexota bacterium]